jgi:hypothetical protein
LKWQSWELHNECDFARKRRKDSLGKNKNADSSQPKSQTSALERIGEAIRAVEACEGELTTDGYRELRARLGHLMDALYKVGGSLSSAT